MTCHSCNRLIPDDGRFCPYCGKPLDGAVTPDPQPHSPSDHATASHPHR